MEHSKSKSVSGLGALILRRAGGVRGPFLFAPRAIAANENNPSVEEETTKSPAMRVYLSCLVLLFARRKKALRAADMFPS